MGQRADHSGGKPGGDSLQKPAVGGRAAQRGEVAGLRHDARRDASLDATAGRFDFSLRVGYGHNIATAQLSRSFRDLDGARVGTRALMILIPTTSDACIGVRREALASASLEAGLPTMNLRCLAYALPLSLLSWTCIFFGVAVATGYLGM
jgi:hypothetical protein